MAVSLEKLRAIAKRARENAEFRARLLTSENQGQLNTQVRDQGADDIADIADALVEIAQLVRP